MLVVLPTKERGYIETSLIQIKSATERLLARGGAPVSEFLVDITIPLQANPMIFFLWALNSRPVNLVPFEYKGIRCEQFPILDKRALAVEQRRSSMPNVETRPEKIQRRTMRANALNKNITRNARNVARKSRTKKNIRK